MILKKGILEGEVFEILPRIFMVVIKNNYDRAMLFCRYQEFYESPFNEIKGKFFTLEDFMKIYTTKNKKEIFTYPVDWHGYNIPSYVLYDAFDVFGQNRNIYDEIMRDIVYFCEKKSKKKPFYLIGTDKTNSITTRHEVAHGLYYTNNNYRDRVAGLLIKIPPKEYKSLKRKLMKMGYCDDPVIIEDEMHAFLSTEPYSFFESNEMKKLSKLFKDNLKKFYK